MIRVLSIGEFLSRSLWASGSYVAILTPIARTADGNWLQNQIITNWESFEDLTRRKILVLSPDSKESSTQMAKKFVIRDQTQSFRVNKDLAWLGEDKRWEYTPTINKTKKTIENVKSAITLSATETSTFFGVPEGWLPGIVILSLREKQVVVLSTNPPFSLYEFIRSCLIDYASATHALATQPIPVRVEEISESLYQLHMKLSPLQAGVQRSFEKEKSLNDGWQRQRDTLCDLLRMIETKSTTNAEMVAPFIEWLYDENDISTDIRSKCTEFLEYIKPLFPSKTVETVQYKLPRAIDKKIKMQKISKRADLLEELSIYENEERKLIDERNLLLKDSRCDFSSTMISVAHKMNLDNIKVDLKLTDPLSGWSATLLAPKQKLQSKLAELKAIDRHKVHLENKNEYDKQNNDTLNITSDKIRVFCSYSEKDEIIKIRLLSYMEGLRRLGLISIWHRGKIQLGNNVDNEITTHLASSDLILLLVSSDFLASDDCYREMEQAISLHKSGKALTIPILLKPVYWEKTPMSVLNPLPTNKRPISLWRDSSDAFYRIVVDIDKIISSLPPQNRPAGEIDWDN